MVKKKVTIESFKPSVKKDTGCYNLFTKLPKINEIL